MNSRQLEAHQWLVALDTRNGLGLCGILDLTAFRLAGDYTAELGTRLDRNGPQGREAYASRIKSALEYHWWRFCQDRFHPLDWVVDRVRGGVLAFGRFPTDLLREVTLAEGVCQHDPRSTEQFLREYSRVISRAAERAGGMRARQELEGFEAELMIPRDTHPPRLASFAGHTPLSAWLNRVVWNQWQVRLRGQRAQSPARIQEASDGRPGPSDSVDEHECLAVLQPLFEESAAVLETDEALLLKMVLLDGVPQQQVARLWGVHKSTVTRARQKVCRKLADEFWHQARQFGRQKEYEECIGWITEASQGMWLKLSRSLADRIRHC